MTVALREPPPQRDPMLPLLATRPRRRTQSALAPHLRPSAGRADAQTRLEEKEDADLHTEPAPGPSCLPSPPACTLLTLFQQEAS